MKVYIVTSEPPYEPGDIVDVYDTEEKAVEYIESQKDNYYGQYLNYSEWEVK